MWHHDIKINVSPKYAIYIYIYIYIMYKSSLLLVMVSKVINQQSFSTIITMSLAQLKDPIKHN